MVRRFSLFLFALLTSSLAFSVTVTVSSPTQNSTASAPLHLISQAGGTYPITGWAVYSDSVLVYTGPAVAKVDDYFAVTTGPHQLVIRAWDSSGAYGSAYVSVNVSSSGLPVPPQTATVFNDIQLLSNWNECNASSCAGGSGNGVYWMAQNQSTPSLSGSSMEFFNSGIWDDALFYQQLGPHNAARNFLWDFYFYVDSNSRTSAQALEFDAFQFISGYNYMIGSQCDYGLGVWDTWDEASGRWIASSLSCPKFAANTWHHVQWYVQTMPATHQYKYVTLVVDGISRPVNVVGNARYLAWADGTGVQWQLDVNQTGTGYHEWVDRAKFTIW